MSHLLPILTRYLRGALVTAMVFGASLASAESVVLDDFAKIDGWRAYPSEGASATLTSIPGPHGSALAMDFDISRGRGHAIARKDFAIDLPANYQFTFDLRADSPVNNFEFKLLDAEGNVWWQKTLDFQFPTEWTKQRIARRHLSFAWGPSGGAEIRQLKAIEFVVSCATGGKGRLCIDNLRFEPIDDAAARNARATLDVSSSREGRTPAVDPKGSVVTDWLPASGAAESMSLDFGYARELGGLVIDWKPEEHASEYEVALSDDGATWTTCASVSRGNGGRDHVYLGEQQARHLRLTVHPRATGSPVTLQRLEVKGPDYGASPNAFFQAVASDAPRGCFPRYFTPEQSFWTVVGSPADPSEALINEDGAIEVDQGCFSIEPFLYVDGRLVTWHDAGERQSLERGYLPIPSVEWKSGDLTLTVTAFASGEAGPQSRLWATYRLSNSGAPVRAKLYLALRPFQVNPPWQSMQHAAGWARVARIAYRDGIVMVNDRSVYPLDTPSGFGATTFSSGEIVEHLRAGQLPAETAVDDPLGFGSAALAYDCDLGSGGFREVRLAVPFHGGGIAPVVNQAPENAEADAAKAHEATRRMWEAMLDRFDVRLPSAAQPVIDTVKSNLAYIFINQDGPRIQPGSRNYERAWIRDGSLTSTALLELGITSEVRDYADWYSGFQFASGKVPCVVDSRGADPTDEHDSHGQLIYLIMQVYRFTHDTAWLRTRLENVTRAVRFIHQLRELRKTDVYRNGTPEQRACFGLAPESISHEGYSAKPMHSYWDDFFILRGLKDATSIAGILGEPALQAEFAAERDDCAKDLYASIRLAMQNRQIDYIPGCAELGDFDATSTTIALCPVNELGRVPEPALHNTFDRYFRSFEARRDGAVAWKDFTPYENRVIGSFVYLGQKQRAQAALEFFMKQRRPAAWNHWAEVVFPDPRTPRFIGDMPHTWCGSDFIRSVRAMFVYEREQDDALVLGAGVADEWVHDPAGVEVRRMPTYFGPVDYSLKRADGEGGAPLRVVATVGGHLSVPPGGVILKSPLNRRVRAVAGDGRLAAPESDEIVVTRLPAKLTIDY
ncbi:hypothetical protein DB347_24075 [Opitutaceae bacterium EW11]|nr:hypothetical protein DB347_24075 [Opitutaceae bacterium EW11]